MPRANSLGTEAETDHPQSCVVVVFGSLCGQVVHRSSSLTLLALRKCLQGDIQEKQGKRVGSFVFWFVWSSGAQIVLSNSPRTKNVCKETHKTNKGIRVGNFVFWSVWSSAAQSMLNHFPVMIVLSNSPSTVKNYLHGVTRKENGKVVGNLIFSSLFKHLKSVYYNLKPNKTRSYIKFYYAQHTAQ